MTTLPSSSSLTTKSTGAIGVRPASTRNVAVAERSAIPTAIAPIRRDAAGTGAAEINSSVPDWAAKADSATEDDAIGAT